MIHSEIRIILLFMSAYIVNLIYCTSTDRTAVNDSPHGIDLTLRLGPPEAVVRSKIGQSKHIELHPAHSVQMIGSKRKRKHERYNVKPEVSERVTANKISERRIRRNESSRLSAARRRQAIKEKGPEAIKAENARQEIHQDKYLARLSKNPKQLEHYKARKRLKAIERYRKLAGNQITGEAYRNKLNEQQKMRQRLRKEQTAKELQVGIP